MRGKRGVYLVVEQIVNTVLNGAISIDPRHFRIRGFYRELSAHSILCVINDRIFQKGNTPTFYPRIEVFKVMLLIACLHVTFPAIGNAGLSPWCTWIIDKDSNAQRVRLLIQQFF